MNDSGMAETISKHKKQEPLLSIIIPIYNVENYIIRCLDSIKNQTYKKIEVICIDDGSYDNSLEVLQSYKGLSTNIIHLAQSHGVSYARNLGISLSKGDYVTFVDSDDYLNPDTYRIAIKELEAASRVGFVQYNFKCVDGENRIKKTQFVEDDMTLSKSEEFFFYFFDNKKITNNVWCKVYRRDLIGDLRFDETLKVAEDEKFIFDLLKKTNSIRLIKYWGYNYYLRNDGVTSSGDYAKKMGLLVAGDYFVENSPTNIRPLIDMRNISYAVSLFLLVPKKDKKTLKAIRDRIKKTDKKQYLSRTNFKGRLLLYSILLLPGLVKMMKK